MQYQFNPDRLKRARLGAGLSLSRAASALGTTPNQIVKWESGRREPTTRFALRVADALGCDIRDFYDQVDEVAS